MNVSTASTWPERLFRPGSNTDRDVRLDWLWLLGIGLVLIATGIGLRDPWPADEPRFALIARDMVASGEWLLPRVGGEPYADKPPVFFWLIALGLKLTGSLRVAFLLPSLLAGLGCVLLVYDLGRRLWNRETGLAAGLALLLTIQFVWQARQAQIDATLCFWTTLSLYGLLRHLLTGPAWRWYAVGWAAAGLGVITKGVGFLPLLVLIPYAVLRGWRAWPQAGSVAAAVAKGRGDAIKWLIGPLAFILAVSVWLVPMLLAAQRDPSLASYRDEILFQQTVDRYANAWHHHEPFWYFVVNVIPWLWMPLTLLLPWLVRAWRRDLQQRDLRIALLLSWIAIVVLFFSLSSGKRGVYVLPAVPAFALVCAPYLADLARRRNVQRLVFALAVAVAGLCAAAVAYLGLRPDKRTEVIELYQVDPVGPLVLMALAAAIACVLARPRRGLLAFAGALTAVLLVVSFWVNPHMNSARSAADFMRQVEEVADPDAQLGLVAFKEQYLLNVHRGVVHFGHARWREAEQEMADAAAWLAGAEGRQLVVTGSVRAACFKDARSRSLGIANRNEWFIVEGWADPACVARGHADVARYYSPRDLLAGTRLSS